MQKFEKTMKRFFPFIQENPQTGAPSQPVDDLAEIPVPKETIQQRFLTIAESEPFGPVDAANVLDIEPASQTLENLQAHDSEAGAANELKDNQRHTSFYAPVVEGERRKFQFTDATVGEVGFRYGASRDDRRHGRKVRFSRVGTRHYPLV
jgi:hypothetical protein